MAKQIGRKDIEELAAAMGLPLRQGQTVQSAFLSLLERARQLRALEARFRQLGVSSPFDTSTAAGRALERLYEATRLPERYELPRVERKRPRCSEGDHERDPVTPNRCAWCLAELPTEPEEPQCSARGAHCTVGRFTAPLQPGPCVESIERPGFCIFCGRSMREALCEPPRRAGGSAAT